ncbi:MAG: cysteine hydrolase [SAR202 cluster bacterium]|nr:cysteine hydrolase [SAR202 cluster bacterium]|tara:strand:- start:960 stop:1634 length:675 start_codon:yes stop_codon:yes gene_type:complete
MSWKAEDFDSEWSYDELATKFELRNDKAALLVIDIQKGDLVRDSQSEYGIKYPHIVEYWNTRISDFVIPNTSKLISFFRELGSPVIYTRNGAITPNGKEMAKRLRKFTKDTPFRGKDSYEIADQIRPVENELVIDKLTSGAFNFSILDHALRNMKVEDIVIAGILTDMCVLGTARVASELGYNSVISEDACATLTQRAHVEALLMHARVFGRVETSDDIIAELN